MKETYDYRTRKIKRDFKIVRVYKPYEDSTKCKLSGLPCYVDSARCKNCKHYGGLLPISEAHIDGFYIICDHPDQNDSEDIENVLYRYYDWLETKR